MKKFLIILILFLIDRVSKIYLINLQSTGTDVDFYVFPFLNFSLVWNTGIGFGLLSLEPNVFYHIITSIIVIINLVLIYFVCIIKNNQVYMIVLILGGSLGNLYDRFVYFAVPDFVDLHFNDFHWFTFNIADIFITIGIISILYFELTNKANYFKNV